ncbi:MAG TPA: protease complex subunit PrcB family protein [Pyrinomonadaceae bacterium]|nr:protease complex subunit PrcB family protein [Pyrinomonadaceae bacterium]
MARRKFRLILALPLALACGGATGASCGDSRRGSAATNGNNQITKPTPANDASRGVEAGEKMKTDGGELKSIGAGAQSQVEDAFVAVARDAETYAALRGLQAGLPELRADFFDSNAIVAAFLGRRNTGGYSVEIARGPEGALRVSESAPPKDAMVTMALTAPYRVVSLAHSPEHPVRLQLGDAWQRHSRPYRVTAGEFTMIGGFAGVREPFKVAGTLSVLRHGSLATVVFDLKGEDNARPRTLSDAATGTVNAAGELNIPRLDPGTFILPPRHAMRAAGRFTQDEGKLSLTLDGMRSAVADGFGGRGTLEAEATGAPPKRVATGDSM